MTTSTVLLGIYTFCNVVSMMDMILSGKSLVMSCIMVLMATRGFTWKMYALALLLMFLPSLIILFSCILLENILSFLVHTARNNE
jgi:hypothetical protein